MGTSTLSPTRSSGNAVASADHNLLRAALQGDFVGRATGATASAVAGNNLGTALFPWGTLYTDTLVLNGAPFNPADESSLANKIVSGATRSGSNQPFFILPDGTAASFTLEGATTSLALSISGGAVTVTADIVKSSLTTAPSSNNTCDVDDATLTDQVSSLYTGEHDTTLTIDNAGSEITSRVGQYAAFQKGSEIMLMYIKSSTELTQGYRGFFFDDGGDPIVRETLADNDTLTLLELGWVFVQSDAATVDVSYLTPAYSYAEPGSPATGQYWLDLANQVWKRYGGAGWETINRTLVGVVTINTTACVGARSFDYSASYNPLNTVEPLRDSDTTIITKREQAYLSVYGTYLALDWDGITWDITADLESGLTEATSTLYYLYVTTEGEPVISEERPYNRVTDLKGYYHPYHSWRCVGAAYNDGSDNLVNAAPQDTSHTTLNTQTFTSSGTWIKPGSGNFVRIRCWSGGGSGGRDSGSGAGGGGGGGFAEYVARLSTFGTTETVMVGAGGAGISSNGTGNTGGNTTFGSYVTAYGGVGGGGDDGGVGGGFLSSGVGGGVGGDLSGVQAGGEPSSIYGGGGGGARNDSGGTGGDALWGGAGGGGADTTDGGAAGGTSVHGGNGGAGEDDGGEDGSTPAGGGGGCEDGTSGAGGDGYCEIHVY